MPESLVRGRPSVLKSDRGRARESFDPNGSTRTKLVPSHSNTAGRARNRYGSNALLSEFSTERTLGVNRSSNATGSDHFSPDREGLDPSAWPRPAPRLCIPIFGSRSSASVARPPRLPVRDPCTPHPRLRQNPRAIRWPPRSWMRPPCRGVRRLLRAPS